MTWLSRLGALAVLGTAALALQACGSDREIPMAHGGSAMSSKAGMRMGTGTSTGMSTGMAAAGQMADTRGMDLIDAIRSTGMHNTLAAAIEAAQREAMLREPGPYTVFAPTDAAFAALPPGTVESLLRPENRAKLQAILAYHVMPGRVMAAQIPAGMMDAPTANGNMLHVDKRSMTVMVNDAHVVKADIPTRNGVIHVIDKVLLPPM